MSYINRKLGLASLLFLSVVATPVLAADKCLQISKIRTDLGLDPTNTTPVKVHMRRAGYDVNIPNLDTLDHPTCEKLMTDLRAEETKDYIYAKDETGKMNWDKQTWSPVGLMNFLQNDLSQNGCTSIVNPDDDSKSYKITTSTADTLVLTSPASDPDYQFYTITRKADGSYQLISQRKNRSSAAIDKSHYAGEALYNIGWNDFATVTQFSKKDLDKTPLPFKPSLSLASCSNRVGNKEPQVASDPPIKENKGISTGGGQAPTKDGQVSDTPIQ